MREMKYDSTGNPAQIDQPPRSSAVVTQAMSNRANEENPTRNREENMNQDTGKNGKNGKEAHGLVFGLERICTRHSTKAAVSLTTRTASTLQGFQEGVDRNIQPVRKVLALASLLAITAGLFLLIPGSVAHAQGGGSINPNAGADQIFDVLGQIALIGGIVMALGALVAKRFLASMGLALLGGIIWVFCSRPEGTLGGAANWVIDAFTGGGGGN